MSRRLFVAGSEAVGAARLVIGPRAVQVSIRQLGRDVVVDVVDDGPGIAPDVRTTLFDRFTSSKSDEAAGAPSRRYGLGLSLVSEVAAQHGGAVSVVDTGRRGATLRLRLPAVRPAGKLMMFGASAAR